MIIFLVVTKQITELTKQYGMFLRRPCDFKPDNCIFEWVMGVVGCYFFKEVPNIDGETCTAKWVTFSYFL